MVDTFELAVIPSILLLIVDIDVAFVEIFVAFVEIADELFAIASA